MHEIQVEITQTIEFERIRRLAESRYLRIFAANLTYWELLVTIHALDGDPEHGISDYIDRLCSLRRTRLTVQNFIKDRIEDGAFSTVPSNKKSRKTLVLNNALKAEFEAFLGWMNSNLAAPCHSASPLSSGTSVESDCDNGLDHSEDCRPANI